MHSEEPSSNFLCWIFEEEEKKKNPPHFTKSNFF